MGQEISNREKCFEYFSQNDDKDKDEVISRAIKQFGITKSSAMTYYYDWKKQYVSGDIKGINHNPKSGCKSKEKSSLTDEMILEELNKIGFSYLSISPNMIKCIASKFNLEEHTAKFRLEELAKKRKTKEENKKMELTKVTEDEINELCENTEFEKETVAVDDKPAKPADKPSKDCEEPAKDSKKRLRIVRLEGEKLSFSIEGKYVTLYTPQSKSIDVKIEDLKDIIAEIQEFMELKEVVM